MTNCADTGSTLHGSAKFNEVPVVTVHKDNLEKIKPKLIEDIQVMISIKQLKSVTDSFLT